MSGNLSISGQGVGHGKVVPHLTDNGKEVESESVTTNLEADVDRMDDLSGFLVQLDDYHPVLPESLVSYYLEQSGVISPDSNVLKLLSMATEKLVCDIIADSSSVFHQQQQQQQQENNVDVQNYHQNSTSSSTQPGAGVVGTGSGSLGLGLGGNIYSNSNVNVVGSNNVTNHGGGGGGGEGDEMKKGGVPINRMKRASDTLTMKSLRFGLQENNISK